MNGVKEVKPNPETEGIMSKADVVNTTVMLMVFLLCGQAVVYLLMAWMTMPDVDKALNILDDLRNWLLPIISGVFLSYGITRGK